MHLFVVQQFQKVLKSQDHAFEIGHSLLDCIRKTVVLGKLTFFLMLHTVVMGDLIFKRLVKYKNGASATGHLIKCFIGCDHINSKSMYVDQLCRLFSSSGFITKFDNSTTQSKYARLQVPSFCSE